MLQKDLNLCDNNFLLDDAKKDKFNYNNSPFSQEQTTFSFKDFKKSEEINNISDFSEIIKPTPIPYFYDFKKFNLNENINLKKLKDFKSSLININLNKNIISDRTNFFIGKKRSLDNKELLIENNQKDNKSAFKILGNFNQNNINNKNDFIKKKIIKIKQFKKNKLENKIIINDVKEKSLEEKAKEKINILELNEKIPIKKNIFKSIYCEKNNESINTDENGEKKRRGRKPKDNVTSNTKRVHDAFDYDNILRKIQVHFLTFIICFTNDLIEAFLPNHKDLKFKNISYQIKKTVRHSYVEELKTKKIGDILQLQATSKIRKFHNSINKQIYQKLCVLCPFLVKLFDMSYLELFSKYYFFKTSKIICFEGRNVNLSQKTKFFSDLIKKNDIGAEKIQQIAVHNFIENDKNSNQNIFIISKKDI